MTPDDKQFRREVLRRRALRGRRAAQTQAEQERAAVQKEIDRQLSGWSARRILAWSLFVIAAVIALQHLLAHSGWRPLPVTMGWQDLLVGYPVAALLVMAGLLALPATPRRP